MTDVTETQLSKVVVGAGIEVHRVIAAPTFQALRLCAFASKRTPRMLLARRPSSIGYFVIKRNW